MAWWMAIPAVLSAVSSISQSYQQGQGIRAQAGWSRYNAQMGYNTVRSNVQSQSRLAWFNAGLIEKSIGAELSLTGQMISRNIEMIEATTQYNDLLFENELGLLWDGLELDLDQLARQRARERSEMRLDRGVVLDEDSHGEILIDQKTEEAFEAFIVRHKANVGAAEITNQRLQGLWQGKVAAWKVGAEGTRGMATALNNARAQIAGLLGQTAISGMAQMTSADIALNAAMKGADFNQIYGNQMNQNNLVLGLFGSAAQGITAYYDAKVPETPRAPAPASVSVGSGAPGSSILTE